MMLGYFQDLVAGVEAKLQATPTGAPRARKTFVRETARLGARLYSGDNRVAWCGVVAPFDLLHSMGITSCFAEFVGAMLAGTGTANPMLEVAEDAGYGTDSCSYHRAVTGAALQRLMPEPDFLIGTTAPCSGGLAAIENLSRLFEKDLFVLQIPPQGGDSAVRFVADQLEQLVQFVSAHTGEPLDPARLRDAIGKSNEARDLLVETYQLAQAVPSPARSRDLVNFGIVVALLAGSQAGVDVARTYRDEFAARVAAGQGGMPGERLRLMWIQNRIQFKHDLDELLEQEHHAVVVIDELNDVTWEPVDPDDPYTGMARRILSVPLCASADHRIKSLQRLAKDYQVDGAINPCHWGCRQGTGIRGLVEAGLKRVGVPVLNLEVDCVDARNFSPGQLRTRLEAFVEMLTERRAATAQA
ncbi:MAG: 2-hydroxyacyl-CoA dehydratase [Deltaproteobacteria bacterium]|nr:2-hydroxyacyl-CoA dehydratase [Deltaproteobacteria bacterium]